MSLKNLPQEQIKSQPKYNHENSDNVQGLERSQVIKRVDIDGCNWVANQAPATQEYV